MIKTASVIIATRDRAEELKESLACIFKPQIPAGYHLELIIVDNNSSDQTKAVVEGLLPPKGWKVKYLFQPIPGKCRCLNMAIRASVGELLIFTDDDTLAAEGWLAAILDCFKHYPCDVVGGRVLPLYPPGIPEWIKNNAKVLDGPIVLYDHGYDNRPFNIQKMKKFIGANMAVRRQVFAEVGLFNENLGPGNGTMGDDTDFVNRLLQRGEKLVYCGKAMVWHPVHPRRAKLKYLAEWGNTAGHYYAEKERLNHSPMQLRRCFGVPIYLWARTFRLGVALLVSFFNRPKFLKNWIDFHVNVGMVRRYLDSVKFERSS